MVAITETITDLKLLQTSLINNAEIEAKVKQQKNVAITVGMLEEKLADFPKSLLAFGKDTVIFRFLLIEGILQGITLKMYVDDEDEQIKIFDAANPISPVLDKELKYIQYKTGFGGYQLVQVTDDESSIISIPLSLNSEYEQKLKDSNYDLNLIEEKTGLVPASFLKYRPRNTMKIKDLKEKTVYRVLKYLGVSKMYTNSKRYSLQEVRGEQAIGESFEVYANTSLNKIIEKSKLPVDVVIAGKEKNKKGEGDIIKFALAKFAQLKV